MKNGLPRPQLALPLTEIGMPKSFIMAIVDTEPGGSTLQIRSTLNTVCTPFATPRRRVKTAGKLAPLYCELHNGGEYLFV